MIYEYALDPEVLASWAANERDYCFVYRKFGVGQSRLMSEFPGWKNWKARVKQASTALKTENFDEGRLTALLYMVMDKMIKRQNIEYDGTRPWLENAVREHNRLKFHGIVATGNPNYPGYMPSSATELLHDSKWNMEEEKFVPRSAEAMAEAVAPMLHICQEAIFIDRFFNPVPEKGDIDRYLKSFAAFFSVMSKNSRISRIEVHADSRTTDFQRTCSDRMPRIIPNNLRVRFVQLQERPNGPKLHDRYILTDIGGLDFSVGLDVGKGDVMIRLLSRKSYIKLWHDYCGDNPAFDYEADFQIEGTAPLAA